MPKANRDVFLDISPISKCIQTQEKEQNSLLLTYWFLTQYVHKCHYRNHFQAWISERRTTTIVLDTYLTWLQHLMVNFTIWLIAYRIIDINCCSGKTVESHETKNYKYKRAPHCVVYCSLNQFSVLNQKLTAVHCLGMP